MCKVIGAESASCGAGGGIVIMNDLGCIAACLLALGGRDATAPRYYSMTQGNDDDDGDDDD